MWQEFYSVISMNPHNGISVISLTCGLTFRGFSDPLSTIVHKQTILLLTYGHKDN